MYAIDLMLEWASPDGGCGKYYYSYGFCHCIYINIYFIIQVNYILASLLILCLLGCQHIQPKILEVNFCPDINRACQHHPNFINNVFECLFLPESQHSPDLPVTRLKEK